MTEVQMASSVPSRKRFLDNLHRVLPLTASERAILESSGVRSADALMSLLLGFPQLAHEHLRPRDMSLAIHDRMGLSITDSDIGRSREPFTHSDGAGIPEDFPFQVGWQMPLPDTFGAGNDSSGSVDDGGSSGPRKHADRKQATKSSMASVDLEPTSWPVRDQGSRGTCVAFALAACGEYEEQFREVMSPQFLFWATKTAGGDPHPYRDGTQLQYCREALRTQGTCREQHWVYDPTVRQGDVTHESKSAPSPPAILDARRFSRGSVHLARRGPGLAREVARLLRDAGRPVAVSLLVFRDPSTNTSNWNTVSGRKFGEVLDPPPTSVVSGGHAVCLTGFRPDEEEPNGGHFVVRNSWGSTNWGREAKPRAGYGFVSATYVEQFCVEVCQLGP